MGRELKRKQAKKEGKNVKEAQKKNKDKPLSPKMFTTIIVSLLLCFVVLYILIGLFVTKEIKWFDKNNTTEETVQIENKILASDSLRQSEEEYYVYFYDTKDEDSEVSSIMSSLAEKVYRVDLHDDFNSNYIGEASGIVEDISDLKVQNNTVIKVINENIEAYYSGSEEIKIALQ